LAQEYKLVSPYKDTRWFDGEITQNKIIRTPGLYWATITDSSGCEISDSIFIDFPKKIYIPNSFSPNGDRNNDCFKIYLSDDDEVVNFKLLIFDRWGSNIFYTSNPEDCWDGKYKLNESVEGVYVYFLDVETRSCGRSVIKGDLTLLR
jgi:gliding motility-associated-like protein